MIQLIKLFDGADIQTGNDITYGWYLYIWFKHYLSLMGMEYQIRKGKSIL